MYVYSTVPTIRTWGVGVDSTHYMYFTTTWYVLWCTCITGITVASRRRTGCVFHAYVHIYIHLHTRCTCGVALALARTRLLHVGKVDPLRSGDSSMRCVAMYSHVMRLCYTASRCFGARGPIADTVGMRLCVASAWQLVICISVSFSRDVASWFYRDSKALGV